MTVQQVIDYFKNKTEVSKALKINRSAVSQWVKKDAIPPRRQLEIQKLTKGKLKAGL